MTIARRRNNLIGLGLGLVLALLFIVSVASVSLTGERDGGGVALQKHYPLKFDGIGRIDRITDDEIVINDSLYKLSPHIKYYTPTAREGSNIMFRVGSLVGFIKNSAREIKFLWLMEPQIMTTKA